MFNIFDKIILFFFVCFFQFVLHNFEFLWHNWPVFTQFASFWPIWTNLSKEEGYVTKI